MTTFHQPYRQVHLDFHTSADCTQVGVDFNPNEFAQTLKYAHVSSINIFAKCHHGFSYFPTQVGTIHPGLAFDLLGEQIAALHEVGIRAPIYYTILWDDLAGQQHPDWIVVRKDGTLSVRPQLTGDSGWTMLDVSSAYGDFVCSHVEEILNHYPVDGFWFDICFTAPNYSPWSLARMRAAGIRIDDDAQVWHYTRRQNLAFFDRLSRLVREKVPQATLFYNGTVNRDMREMLPYQTHIEVESLPTSGGNWGYLHYPVMARQVRSYGVDFVGMTGRFHKSWGDFGGLKTQDQLDYECGTIVAAGGRISVGDQLHPNGRLDPAVYRLVAGSFERIERLEPWLVDAESVVEIALLTTSQTEQVVSGVGGQPPDIEGAAQFCLESGIQFDILDEQGDLTPYSAVILADGIVLDEAGISRLNSYLSSGGKLVLSGMAALSPGSQRFQSDKIPLTYLGLAPTVPTYIRLDRTLTGSSELQDDYDYAFYEQAHLVRPDPGAQTHGWLRQALFNRTWEHFISHAHAPVGANLDAPLVVQNDQVLYFAAPLFSAYHKHDYWAYRAILANAMRSFLPAPLLLPQAPGWIEFTLHQQAASVDHPARQIIHAVAYHPRRTTQPIQHVDQSWPIHGVSIRLRWEGQSPNNIYLAPDRQALPFSLEADYLNIDLPPLKTHTVIAIE